MDYFNGQMVKSFKESLRQTLNKEKECLFGQMEENISEYGIKANSMV